MAKLEKPAIEYPKKDRNEIPAPSPIPTPTPIPIPTINTSSEHIPAPKRFKTKWILFATIAVFLVVGTLFVIPRLRTKENSPLQLIYSGIRLEEHSVTNILPGDTLTLQVADNVALKNYQYRWSTESSSHKVYSTEDALIFVPDEYVLGKEYSLYVNATYENGLCIDGKEPNESHAQTFNFVITEPPCQVNIYAELNGQPMEHGGTYAVQAGDLITVEASSTEALIEKIGYHWGYENDPEEIIDENSNRITIVVPPQKAGYKELLRVEAIAANDDGSANKVTKTGWQKYTLEYISQVSMDVTINGVLLDNNGSYEVSGGETVFVSAKSSVADIAFISYYFSSLDKDNMENTVKIKGDTATFTVPKFSSDEPIILSIEAVAENDNGKDNTITKTGWMNYALSPKGGRYIKVSVNDMVAQPDTVTTVHTGDIIRIQAYPEDECVELLWKENNAETESHHMPDIYYSFPEMTEPYYLLVNARYSDGLFADGMSSENTTYRCYTFISATQK